MSKPEYKTMYETGEKAPIGTYFCINCSEQNFDDTKEYNALTDTTRYFEVKKDGNKLPNCPLCGRTYWCRY